MRVPGRGKISFLSGKVPSLGVRIPAAARPAVKPRHALHVTNLHCAHYVASAVPGAFIKVNLFTF